MLNITTEITFLALCAVKSQLPSIPTEDQPPSIQPQPLPIQLQSLPEVENDNPSTVANDGMLIVCVGVSHRYLVYSELNIVQLRVVVVVISEILITYMSSIVSTKHLCTCLD